jgi:CO/xanthine dehydrogenase Mo-binding subunit
MKTGRPVKYRWTRAEDLIYSTHRGMYHMYVKDGVTGDGRIVARYLRTIHDCGAYGGTNQGVLEKHSAMGAGPYYIPNVLIEAYGILTNHPRAGAMRGFGVTASNFAIEVQMDRIAGQLGLDPWEIRLKNALRRGDQMPGCVLEQVAAIEVMQAVAARAGITLPTHLQAMSSTQGRDSDEGAR